MAMLIALAAATPLVLASGLTPAEAGVGTHRGLGLPACGWQASMGLPCPSCGMTTSFAHAVRGDVLKAAMVQPAGLLACVLTAGVVLGGLYAAITGAPLQRVVSAGLQPRIVWWGLVILLIGWAVTMSRAVLA